MSVAGPTNDNSELRETAIPSSKSSNFWVGSADPQAQAPAVGDPAQAMAGSHLDGQSVLAGGIEAAAASAAGVRDGLPATAFSATPGSARLSGGAAGTGAGSSTGTGAGAGVGVGTSRSRGPSPLRRKGPSLPYLAPLDVPLTRRPAAGAAAGGAGGGGGGAGGSPKAGGAVEAAVLGGGRQAGDEAGKRAGLVRTATAPTSVFADLELVSGADVIDSMATAAAGTAATVSAAATGAVAGVAAAAAAGSGAGGVSGAGSMPGASLGAGAGTVRAGEVGRNLSPGKESSLPVAQPMGAGPAAGVQGRTGVDSPQKAPFQAPQTQPAPVMPVPVGRKSPDRFSPPPPHVPSVPAVSSGADQHRQMQPHPHDGNRAKSGPLGDGRSSSFESTALPSHASAMTSVSAPPLPHSMTAPRLAPVPGIAAAASMGPMQGNRPPALPLPAPKQGRWSKSKKQLGEGGFGSVYQAYDM